MGRRGQLPRYSITFHFIFHKTINLVYVTGEDNIRESSCAFTRTKDNIKKEKQMMNPYGQYIANNRINEVNNINFNKCTI